MTDVSKNAELQPLPERREQRFPSIEERTKLYMSSWYTPPCKNYTPATISYRYEEHANSTWPSVIVTGMKDRPKLKAGKVLSLQSAVEADKLFFIDRETIFTCAKITLNHTSSNRQSQISKDRSEHPPNMGMYCHDTINSILPALDHITWELEEQTKLPPILVQFGDSPMSRIFRAVNVPHLKKFRSAVAKKDSLQQLDDGDCVSSPRKMLSTVHNWDKSFFVPAGPPSMYNKFEPIIWKLATRRHFRLVSEVDPIDILWNKKKDMAVFRGSLTGIVGHYDTNKSDHENCQSMIRCRLCYNFANSTLVDAKLIRTKNRISRNINGVDLLSSEMGMAELLSYKGLVMIEGNDVSSGLKWALKSQSVVLMPRPKHTSWAMEELLEPWVHYIPLDDDALNLGERMQWVIDNDEKAQHIARRGAMWMEDLVLHPDAAAEDRLIQQDIIRRYSAHFVEAKQKH